MKKKVISTRTEKRRTALMDLLVNSLCTGAVILFSAGGTGMDKRDILAGCFSVLMVMGFMTVLEAYSLSTATQQERKVCLFLSCLYTSILLLLYNWIFIGSVSLAWKQLLIFAVSLVAMLAANHVFYQFCRSSRFEKQRLLVIAGEGSDFFRMKRLKYGTLSQFDSWYESINPDDVAALRQLTDEKMEKYDAICIFDNLSDDIYEKIIKQAMLLNKEVYAIPKIIDVNRNQARYIRFDDILAFHIQNYAISPAQQFWKRAFDLVSSLIALVIAAIPMLIIAICIKVTSPGPVFYRQLRYTKDKKEFYIYKFRTMIPDAEKYTGAVFAQKDDPRITPIGRILRSTRLDELPQLLNIVKGDMSVVGPRPERPVFVEQFEKEIENYNYRFVVKAGLTSLSHVYGRYSTYIHDRTCYDLLYISNYSFLMDLKIILLTTKTILIKEAAEGEDEYKQATYKT